MDEKQPRNWPSPLVTAIVLAGAALTLANVRLRADDSIAKTADASSIRPALVLSLHTNLGYCREWASANDYKSLRQGLGGMAIIIDALARHTAAGGAEKIAALRESLDKVNTAARSEDAAATKSSLAALSKAIDDCAALPAGAVPANIGKNSAGFKALMHVVDGTYADAKTALAVGEAAEAKSHALVLAELGQWLAAERGDARWREFSHSMTTAARDAAATAAADEKTLRGKFRDIYVRCEACHDGRR